MPILEERGLFWLSDTPVPTNQFAPDDSIAGVLTVDDDGYVSLELDNYFPNNHGPFGIFAGLRKPLGKDVHGILKESNSRVLLTGVLPNGGQTRTNGLSYQRFVATDCIVGSFDLSSDQPLVFAGLDIDLAGFEDWFWLRSIKVTRTADRIAAIYERPAAAAYKLVGETMTFDFGFNGSVPFQLGDEISIKETVTLGFSFEQKQTLESLRDRFRFFEELLILLTDSEFRLRWPLVVIDPETRVRWYFGRFRPQKIAEQPETHTCLTHFPKVREAFGDIWSNWTRAREEFGPGVYLYLGTRRGMPLYGEHRFVNLIWGLETFHRIKNPADPDSMNQRIDAIVAQISGERDKKLVRRQLRFAHEPGLAVRLFQLFRTLPLELEEKRLRDFTDACAKARNDISHHGTHRGEGSYADFLKGLEQKSAALSTLHHCLILREIGVPDTILKEWTSKGWGAFHIKYRFVEVGLLDKTVLDPPANSSV